MEARNINDIVKSASRSSQGRMQIIKCQSDLLLKIGFWCSVLSTSYLPGNKQQIAGTTIMELTLNLSLILHAYSECWPAGKTAVLSTIWLSSRFTT